MRSELRNYLPCGWLVKLTTSGLCLLAPSQESAEAFLELSICDLIQSAKQLSTPIAIAWRGCKVPLRVSPRMMLGGVEPESVKRMWIDGISRKQPAPVVRSRVELDWTAIQQGSNPVYISQMRDQHNLYLNAAAVSAQSEKPPAEFLSATAHTLNFEDELLERCEHLGQNGQLIEYTYQALRWFRDPDSQLMIRRRMQFVSSFYRVHYLGQDCWLGEVLSAAPLERFVDNS